MAMCFKNPANGYVEEISCAPLWSLLAGFFYFAAKGVWTHAAGGAALAIVTCGLSWAIYPCFANQIMRTHYLRRGWIDVSGVPPTSTASSPPLPSFDKPPPVVNHGAKEHARLTIEKEVSFWNKEVPAKIWVPILDVCVGLVAVAITEATRPPPTPQEVAAQQAAREKAQVKEARLDALRARSRRGDHLTTEDCTELYGAESSLCKPIMSAGAWRQYQSEAAQSHENAVAARRYSDTLHDYVQTYHRLPPQHVVIDPN